MRRTKRMRQNANFWDHIVANCGFFEIVSGMFAFPKSKLETTSSDIILLYSLLFLGVEGINT